MAISAEFTADFSQFTAAAEGAQAAVTGVTTASENLGVRIEQQAAVAGGAIRNFAGQVSDFAGDYIAAFAEEEAATARLTAALGEQGEASAATVTAYQAMAEQFQTTTRYSDDAVTAAQTALTQIGRIGPEQMEPAIAAAADLAAALGIGLEEAAIKLATVIGSDGAKLGTLKKYLTDTEVKGKSAAEVLAIFNQKFGGAAAADMDTTTGKLDAFNNKLDDFKGKVGGVLASALTPLLDAFTSLSPALQTVIAGGAALVVALVPVGIAFASMVSGITGLVALLGGSAGLTAAFTAIGVVLAGITAPMWGAIAAVTAVYVAFKNWDAITGIVRAVYTAIKTWLVDAFNALIGSILHPIDTITNAFKTMYDKVVGHSYVPDMINGIGAQFQRLDAEMVQPAAAAAAAVMSSFASMQTQIASTGYDLFGRPAAPIAGVRTMSWEERRQVGQAPVTVNVQGNVLSTSADLARLVGDAVSDAFRRNGNRQPV